jgi:hypothetical protein
MLTSPYRDRRTMSNKETGRCGSKVIMSAVNGQVIMSGWDFTELFEGGFEVVDDLLGKNVGIGKIVGVFAAFISAPENVESKKRLLFFTSLLDPNLC